MMHPQELHQLAWEFFRHFSRMEYALKAAGIHRENNGRAEADWDAFAGKVVGVFTAPAGGVKAAMEYLLRDPPKKQVIRAGRVEWAPWAPPKKSKAVQVLACVRQVRNNLFHGGKYNGVSWDMPDRSALLMNHGLAILSACLAAAPAEVRGYFETGGPLDTEPSNQHAAD